MNVGGLFWLAILHSHARFYFGDFRDRSHLVTSAGTVRRSNGCLSLASPSSGNGWAWYASSVRFDNGTGFLSTFHFRVLSQSSQESSSREQAGSGIAFVIQGAGNKEGGKGGSQNGYGGLSNAIAVEFDTKMDLKERDPNSNHVSVHSSLCRSDSEVSAFEGNSDWVHSLPAVVSLRDGKLFTVQVAYTPPLVKVFLNDLVHPIIHAKVGFLVGEIWPGFTAASSDHDTYEVCDWYFERTQHWAPAAETNHSHYLSRGSEHPINKHGVDKTSHRHSESSHSEIPPREPCDNGFNGLSCGLDPTAALDSCLSASVHGCVACTTGLHDCRWCVADSRCVHGASVHDTGRAYCSDPSSTVANSEQCVLVPGAWFWMSALPLSFLAAAVVVAVCGVACIRASGGTAALGCGSGRSESPGNSEPRKKQRKEGDEASSGSDSDLDVAVHVVGVGTKNNNKAGSRSRLDVDPIGVGGRSPSPVDVVGHHSLQNATSLGLAAAGGASLVVVVSLAVNIILIEITLSQPFCFIFGLILVFTGGLLLFLTILAHCGSGGALSMSVVDLMLLVLFSIAMEGSGVVCFLLQKDWSSDLSAHAKVPLYSILGVSASFGVLFVLLEAFKLVTMAPADESDAEDTESLDSEEPGFNRGRHMRFCCCRNLLCPALALYPNQPMVESSAQVRLVTITAILAGLYFGWVFGVLDLEDINNNHVGVALQRDNFYCFPFAASLGGLVGVVVEYVHLRSIQPVPVMLFPPSHQLSLRDFD